MIRFLGSNESNACANLGAERQKIWPTQWYRTFTVALQGVQIPIDIIGNTSVLNVKGRGLDDDSILQLRKRQNSSLARGHPIFLPATRVG